MDEMEQEIQETNEPMVFLFYLKSQLYGIGDAYRS